MSRKEVKVPDLCEECGQLMLPVGMKKRPNQYDHASGCPNGPLAQRKKLKQAEKGKR